MKRFEIHNIIGIVLVAFGFSVLFLRSDVVGVTAVLYETAVLGLPLSDVVGLAIILGGLLYLLAIRVPELDRFWWHWFCATSLVGYMVPAYIFWIENESGVTFTLSAGMLLCFYALIAYHYRYEVLPKTLRRDNDV